MLNRYNPLHMFLASYGNELNRIDYRLLKESSNSQNSVASFSYNGLIYSFNQELNMFVNQFGHAMDYAQAISLASSLGYSEAEFEGFADNSDTDGGAQRSASISIPNTTVYGYGGSPYGFAFGVSWPTQYNDTKGLSYYYPVINYYPTHLGPQRSLVESRTFSTANENSTDPSGWTAVGTLSDNYYNFIFNVDYLKQPTVPASFNFGATAHGITLYADQIIQGYNWIPPQNRYFHPSKSWSAYNTVSGIDNTEVNLRRFNYLTQGNSFTNWTFTGGATFVNVTGLTGPNGVTATNLRAYRISFPGASTPKIARSVTLPTAGWTYTASVFIQGLTVNDLISLNVVGASGASLTGTKILGTTWGRYQVVFGAQNPGSVTFEISGNTGGAGQWATNFNIWGAQIEQANGVRGDGFRTIIDNDSNGIPQDSPANIYYIDTSTTAASVIDRSDQKSFWLARKGQYVERELRNLFTYLRNNGFTMGAMTLDDEGYYQFFPGEQNSTRSSYVWEYNSLHQNESSAGNTWYISPTGISAQPRCMFQKTSRFGLPGVTNFRDLLLLRGFTTNPAATGWIDGLNFRQYQNRNAVSTNDPRAYMSNIFWQATTEMIGYFVEDGVVTPFKELMLGNTADTTAPISNYGYVDNYVAFIGNTYVDGSGNAIVAGLSNLGVPNIQTLFNAGTNEGLVSSKTIIDSFYRFEGDNGYSPRTLSYNKCGNYSSPSTYGTWHGGGPGYGYYWFDSLQYPGARNILGNIGARAVFDFQNASVPINYYGYTGSTWANAGQAAYTVAGFATGRTRTKQVHIPGRWRGVTMLGGVGQTFSCSLCFDSNSATYTGVSAGFGVTCLGCNNQQVYTVDYFMNDLWGITQATDSLAPVGIIPASLRAATNGLTQGQLSAEWATYSNGANPSEYFTPCGTPIPGVTLVPGTIYRDYDTHWYWMGWLGFMLDLGQHRESATTRVYEALEERNRTGNPAVPQKPYDVWIHTPTYALQGILNEWFTNWNGVTNYPEYRHNITSYSYFKPLGITYDLVTWYYSDAGAYINKGATVFYGDINHYWAENIRHAYLHKVITFDQWGSASYGCVVNPGRTTQAYRYNQTWEKGTWARSAGDTRGLIYNSDEIRTMLGNDKVFLAPSPSLAGTSGCTLGGVCAPMAYKLIGQRLNTLIKEVNDQGGGMVQETMYLAPINWAEKEYAISGAQLTSGMYLWRITFLNKATQPIYVKGSRYGDQTGVTYNVVGVTNFIDNPNHEKGIWWACSAYELPIVTNPPVTPNNGLPPGTTTWNGLSGAGSSPQFPLGVANTSVLF